MRRSFLRCSNGFSLIELSISLALLGLVTGATISLMTNSNGVSSLGSGVFYQDQIDTSIQGFLKANFRLPCPDVNSDGVEDCSITGTKVSTGSLPVSTLQLSFPSDQKWRLPIAYGIFRGMQPSGTDDLGIVSSQRYTKIPSQHPPLCPPGTAVESCDIGDPGFNAPAELETDDLVTMNVLDVCYALLTADDGTSSGVVTSLLHSGLTDSATRSNVAYAFSWSSTPIIISGSDILESRQYPANPLRFLPSGISQLGSDDLTEVKSFSSLAETFECSERLGDSALARQSASTLMTNEYLNRVRLAHMKMLHQDAQGSVDAAERRIVFASVDMVLATASLVVTIAEAFQGNPVAAINVAVTTLELANAVAAIPLATANRDDAAAWLIHIQTSALTPSRSRLKSAGERLVDARSVADIVQRRGRL
jgi:prepilin-type N-terminal cleavage/methylation domain-containing protein